MKNNTQKFFISTTFLLIQFYSTNPIDFIDSTDAIDFIDSIDSIDLIHFTHFY